jgi:MYXO-CTERM domain-containing protein
VIGCGCSMAAHGYADTAALLLVLLLLLLLQ